MRGLRVPPRRSIAALLAGSAVCAAAPAAEARTVRVKLPRAGAKNLRVAVPKAGDLTVGVIDSRNGAVALRVLNRRELPRGVHVVAASGRRRGTKARYRTIVAIARSRQAGGARAAQTDLAGILRLAVDTKGPTLYEQAQFVSAAMGDCGSPTIVPDRSPGCRVPQELICLPECDAWPAQVETGSLFAGRPLVTTLLSCAQPLGGARCPRAGDLLDGAIDAALDRPVSAAVAAYLAEPDFVRVRDITATRMAPRVAGVGPIFSRPVDGLLVVPDSADFAGPAQGSGGLLRGRDFLYIDPTVPQANPFANFRLASAPRAGSFGRLYVVDGGRLVEPRGGNAIRIAPPPDFTCAVTQTLVSSVLVNGEPVTQPSSSTTFDCDTTIRVFWIDADGLIEQSADEAGSPGSVVNLGNGRSRVVFEGPFAEAKGWTFGLTVNGFAPTTRLDVTIDADGPAQTGKGGELRIIDQGQGRVDDVM